VRVVRGPQAGRVGKVQALGERPALAPSGVRTLMAQVVLDGASDALSVPAPNLELLE
jgi:hypothetical protein